VYRLTYTGYHVPELCDTVLHNPGLKFHEHTSTITRETVAMCMEQIIHWNKTPLCGCWRYCPISIERVGY